jgi:plastocyanin
MLFMNSLLSRRVSRRTVIRSLAASTLVATSLFSTFGRSFAQEGADPSFSDTLLPALGLPEINLEQSLAGVTGVPESIPAGRYLVNYTGTDAVGYLLFAQYPADTPLEQALEEAKAAGSNDQQIAGWTYGGGSYVQPGATVQVVIELTAGEWNVVASHMPEGGDFETEEIYEIVPFTVTEAASATPVAEIEATINVQTPGMVFEMDSDTIAAGPNIWKFENNGDQSHHVVMMRTPELVDQEDLDFLFEAFASGTPPAGDNWYTLSQWVAYTALFSPGQTVWNEFDLEPGTYLLLCWISDTETGMPHVMMGMWKSFTVA